jgi:integrating conjugative element protein (TIGR03758 family)
MMGGPQITAFKGSTGGALPSQLFILIVLTMSVIYFLWLAWLSISAFRLWYEGNGDFYQVMSVSIRGAVVVLFMGYIFSI